MTTTVTITTHDWPVAVETHDNFEYLGPTHRGHGYRTEVAFVGKNATVEMHVTASRTVTVRELPVEATDLSADKSYHPSLGMQTVSTAAEPTPEQPE